MAVGTRLTAISDYLFRRLFKVLFRYDVFISYARRDGKGYALKLKEQLTRLDFSCFLDYDELPAGNSLNRTLKRAIKKSATIIVVGTEGALKSHYVELEVGEFARTGRSIIPIDFEGTLANAPWPVIKERDLVWVDETKDALAKSAPSPPVADAIDKLFKYTRRNVRVRGQVIATAALFLLGAAISVVVIRQQVAAANVQRHEAEASKRVAEVQQKNAEDAAGRAKVQEDLAKASAKVADDERKNSLAQTEIAKTQTALAEKQMTIARAKAAEAKQQQLIAEQQQKLATSRELAANSMSQLQIDPELSLVLASKSAEAARTFEGEDALRRSLLESQVRAVAEGHRGEVTNASFTPDGKFTVATGDDNTTKVLRLSDGQVVAELRGETKPRWGASFSPNGEFVVTAGDDKSVRIWEWRANRLMPEPLRHPEVVTGARFSHDGSSVITTSDDNAARVWDTKTGRRISPVLYGIVAREGRGPREITIKPLSPDGRYVFFQTAKDEGEENRPRKSSMILDGVHENVWDVSAGRVLPELKELRTVLSAAINTEQKIMVTNGYPARVDGGPVIWDLTTGLSFAVLRETNTVGVNALALSPDGTLVVTANSDNVARVWEVPENRERDAEKSNNEVEGQVLDKPMWLLSGHRGPVRSVAFSPDGRFILTASDDRTARVWDVKTGREVSVLRGHRRGVLSAAFSPDGKRVITSGDDATARVWDAGMGQGFVELTGQGEVESALFSTRGARFVTTNNTQIARVWKATTGESLPQTWSAHAAILSPDGKMIVTANQEVPRIHDVASGRPSVKQLDHAGEVLSAVYSANGKFVATVGRDGIVRVCDTQTGKVAKELAVEKEAVTRLAFSPGGDLLLMMGVNKAQIWEWDTERRPVVLPDFFGSGEFIDDPGRVGFSADGRFVAGPSGETAAIWDAHAGCRIKIQLRHNSGVHGAVFSPDQHSLLSVDSYAAKLWQLPATLDCEREAEVLEPKFDLDHSKTGPLAKRGARFSPDGKFIFLTSIMGTPVQVFDSSTGERTRKLGDDSTRTFGAAVSSDSKLIVTASEDGNAYIWDHDGNLLQTLKGNPAVPLKAASFSLNDKLIVTVSDPRFNIVTLWETGTWKRVGEKLRGQAAAFSPDGESVLTISGGDVAQVSDVSNGRVIAELQGLTGKVTNLAVSDDGQRVMAVTSDRTVGVWEAGSGRNLARREYAGDIRSVALSPDGKLVATISRISSDQAHVWNTETDKVMQFWKDGDPDSIALSPDGRFVITTAGYTSQGNPYSEVTKVWDIVTGAEVTQAKRAGSFAAFSRDGKRMVTINEDMASVSDTLTWETVAELRGHSDQINSAGFSPDGRFIVTASDDKTALVWDAETGAREIGLFGDVNYGLASAAFSPDGASILVVGKDKTARLYTCVMCGGWDELRNRARERFARHPRNLTPDEQKKFTRQTSSGVAGVRPSSLAVP